MFRPVFNIYKCVSTMERNVSTVAEDRTYQAAIDTLRTFISNAADRNSSQDRQYNDAKQQMTKNCIRRCGIDLKELDEALSVIHVSGTKGKGSTCAFCETILRQYGFKTGFFSSPHLVSVRERIMINGHPLSKLQFSNYFWEVHQKLNESQEMNDDMPTYFVFLTVMAMKVFYSEKVDVVILEVGIGGEYDCTNLLSTADVVGITSLGIDHTHLLGNTIEEIAWQKSGIMKPGAIAIASAEQLPQALKVVADRAMSKKCRIFEAPPLSKYEWLYGMPKISLNGPKQHLNASLALQLVNCWINPHIYKEMPYNRSEQYTIQPAPVFPVTKEMVNGLESCIWLGRTQILDYSFHIRYYLDGAHTIDSIKSCVHWYQNQLQQTISSNDKIQRMLIFYVSGNRNVSDFVHILVPYQFDYVLCCPPDCTYSDVVSNIEKKSSKCEMVYRTWCAMSKHTPENNIILFSCIRDALDFVSVIEKSTQTHIHALITGSLYLVGGVLSILRPQLKDS